QTQTIPPSHNIRQLERYIPHPSAAIRPLRRSSSSLTSGGSARAPVPNGQVAEAKIQAPAFAGNYRKEKSAVTADPGGHVQEKGAATQPEARPHSSAQAHPQ